MRGARFVLLAFGIATLSVLAGLFAYQHFAGVPSAPPVSSTTLVKTALPDLEGNLHQLDEWRGQVLVVNFWATWCPPCRREIPSFIKLQESYGHRGLQFVGIAIDRPDMVKDFVDTMSINYPVLIGDTNAIQLAQRYGNRVGALPYTVVFDRGGNVAYTKVGEFSREQAEQTITSLL